MALDVSGTGTTSGSYSPSATSRPTSVTTCTERFTTLMVPSTELVPSRRTASTTCAGSRRGGTSSVTRITVREVDSCPSRTSSTVASTAS